MGPIVSGTIVSGLGPVTHLSTSDQCHHRKTRSWAAAAATAEVAGVAGVAGVAAVPAGRVPAARVLVARVPTARAVRAEGAACFPVGGDGGGCAAG